MPLKNRQKAGSLPAFCLYSADIQEHEFLYFNLTKKLQEGIVGN